jgi:hypothetical protein
MSKKIASKVFRNRQIVAYNLRVGRNKSSRTLGLVAAALIVGIVGGLVLRRPSTPELAFLKEAKAIAVQDASVETSGGLISGTSTFFSFHGDWESVYRQALEEMPNAIVRDTYIGDTPAKVLTIPRVENGRTRVFFPPVREITILPDKLVLTEGGSVVSRRANNYASVKVSEYRAPHLLDTAVDWVRDHLSI